MLASGAGLATVAATLTSVAAPQVARAVAPGVITSAGPLTTIGVTPDLNCYTRRTDDSDGEWYNGRNAATNGDDACGTFAVVNNALYGPASVPAGDSATGAETAAWTPVSQSAVSGTGAVTSPYTLTTIVAAGSTGVTVTETDTYVTGHEGYSTYISATNASGAAVNVTLYHAGDCFLQDEDYGFGVVDASTGSAGCQAETLPAADPQVRGTRVEQLFPLTQGSSYMEAFFDTIWDKIASKQVFPNTCDCADTDFEDNGVGLSWNVPALASGGTVQEGVYTSLSPTGIVPATTGNVADAPSVIAGTGDGYTVTVRNTGAAAIHLVGVTDLLPAGFTYTAGSTTGLTTANPAVAGQALTWTIPSTVVAAHASATLHFNFTAAAAAGDYTNSASGISTETAVVPAGPFAPLHVITVPAAPAPVGAAGGLKTATVTWVAPTAIGNSVLTAYDVLITPAGGTAIQHSVPATSLSTVVTGLKAGKAYTFQVRADNAAGSSVWSAPVTLGGVALTNAKVSTTLTYGQSRVLKVTAKSGSAGLVGAQLKLMVRTAGKHTWSVAGRSVTKSGGVASIKVKPARGSIYEWVFNGDAGHTGAIVDRTLTVAPSISIVLTGKGKVLRNAAATASGKVSPVFAKQLVYLQKLVGKRWVSVGSAKISKSGGYVLGLPTGTRGVFVYRVAKGHSGAYVTAYSALKALRVV